MVLANQAQVRRRRHAERFRGSADGKVLVDDDAELALGDLQSRAAEPLALGASATKTGTDPFHDEAALQLRDGGDDGEHRLAQRRPRVDLLAQAYKFHVEMVEEVECFHEMTHRTPEAVEGGDHDYIDAPGLHLGHHPVEGGAAFASARGTLIDVLRYLLPAPGTAVVAEIAKLVVAGLVGGAHATVQGNALHWSLSSSGALAPRGAEWASWALESRPPRSRGTTARCGSWFCSSWSSVPLRSHISGEAQASLAA